MKQLLDRFNERFNKLEDCCYDLLDPVYEKASERESGKSSAGIILGKRPFQTAVTPAIKKLKREEAAESDTNKNAVEVAQTKASTSVEPPEEDVEPTEMALEEIESRTGSLVQPHTITLLKSAVSEERLDGISSLKQQVQDIQDLDQSAELLIRLLCTLPGWGEEDVQVQLQVIEVITYIAATANKFPKKCVILCLLGLSERLTYRKTRVPAMDCLTTFSKAVGPGFIFERLYKILKEHKDPLVLSEGILWMAAGVVNFGVSHLNLKDLIEFVGETGLQSSTTRARSASLEFFSVLIDTVGAEGFLKFISLHWPGVLLRIVRFGMMHASRLSSEYGVDCL